MDEEKGNGHVDRGSKRAQAREQPEHHQDRTNNLANDRQNQTVLMPDLEWIRKFPGHLLKRAELGPAMQQQQRKSQPETQHQQPRIRVRWNEIEAKDRSKFFHGDSAVW